MPSSHQNWQYLGASGYVGAYTTTGGGGTPIVPHDRLDSLRIGVGRTPSAEYPDGYLGTIRSRRDDKGKPYAVSDSVLDSLRSRQNQRGYQRGVHKGERIDLGDYVWPDGLEPDRRLKARVKPIDNMGSINYMVKRNVPQSNLAPAPHLVNDGKANVSSNVPLEFNPQVVTKQFAHLTPRWK